MCDTHLTVTRLQCPHCATEVTGAFSLSRLATVREPHASVLELFLRVRGNLKEMERELGLSYPTVRARVEEALEAVGLGRASQRAVEEDAEQRSAILDELERGNVSAAEAADLLRQLRVRRQTW